MEEKRATIEFVLGELVAGDKVMGISKINDSSSSSFRIDWT